MAYIPGAETSSEVDYREGVGLDLIAEFQQQAENPNYNHTFEVDWAQCEELIVECDSQPNSDTPASANAGIKLLISNETAQWWYRQLSYQNVNTIQSTTNWANAPAGAAAANNIWLHGSGVSGAQYGCYGKITLRRNSDHALFGTQYIAYSTPGERTNTAPNITAYSEVWTTAALENRVSRFSIQPAAQNISKNYHIKVWARRTVATVDISALELVWEGKIDGSLQKPVQIPIRQTGEDTIHFEFTARRLPNAAVSALSDTILGNMTMGFTYNTLNAVAGSWYTADTADSSRTVDTCGRLTLESANRMNTNSGYGTIFKNVDTEDPSKGAGNPRIAVSMHLDERGDAYNSASYCRPCWMSTATRSTAADVTNNLYLHVHRQYELDIRFYRKADVAQLAHSPDHQSGLVVTNAGKNTVEISAGNIEVNGRVLHNRFPMTVYLPDALRNGDVIVTSAAMYLYAANNHGELNIKFAQDGPVYDRYGNQYRDISAMPENVAAYHPKEGRTWRWFASLEIDKDGMITNIVQRHNAYTVSTLGGGNIPDAVGTIRYAMPGAEVPSFWLRADGSEYDPAAWPELAKVLPPVGDTRLKPTGYEVYDAAGMHGGYPLSNLFDGSHSYTHSNGALPFPAGKDPREVYHSWGFIFNEPITLRAWKLVAGSNTTFGTAPVRGVRLYGQEKDSEEWILLDNSHWPYQMGAADSGLYAAFDQLSYLAPTDKKWYKLRLDVAPPMFGYAVYAEELFLYGDGDKYVLPNIPSSDAGFSYIVAARKVYNGEKPPLDAWDNLYIPGNVYINHSDSDIVGAIKYVMPGSVVPDLWIRADGREFDPVKYPELAAILPPVGDKLSIASGTVLDTYGLNGSHPLDNLFDASETNFVHSNQLPSADANTSWEFTLSAESEITGYRLWGGRTDAYEYKQGHHGLKLYGQVSGSTEWELLYDGAYPRPEGAGSAYNDAFTLHRIKHTSKQYAKVRLDLWPVPESGDGYWIYATLFELYGKGNTYTVPKIGASDQGEAYIVAKMENRQQKVNVDVMSSDDVGTIKEIFGVPQKKNWLPCNGQEFDPAMWPELARQLGPSYSNDIIKITATAHGPATSLAGGSLATATNGVYTPVSNTGAQMGYVEAGTRQYVIAALETPSEIACVKAAVGWQANQYPSWDARQFRLYATETDAGDDNWTEIGRSVDWTSGIEEYYGHEIFVWEQYRGTKWHRIKIEALGTRQNSNNGQTSFILRELTAHAPSVDVYRVPLLYPAHNGAQVYIIAQSDSTVSVHGDDAYIGELRQFHLKTPPTGWYVCNGQVIQNANEKCPLLLKHLVDNSWKCVTEDVWQEKRNAAQETGAAGGVPYYVYDLIANTLRLPNIMGDVFKSAPTSDRVGEWEGDAIRNITGEFKSVFTPSPGATWGVISKNSAGNADPEESVGGAFVPGDATSCGMNPLNTITGWGLKFNASKVVPTADENRVRSILLLPCVCYDSSFVEKATTFAAPEPSDPVVHSSVEIGTIMQYVAGAEPPANWIKCDGKALDTEAYPELAKILSHITDFNVKLTNITAAASATSVGSAANLLDNNAGTYWEWYTTGNTNWLTQNKPHVVFTFAEPTAVGGCGVVPSVIPTIYEEQRGFSSLRLQGSTEETGEDWFNLSIMRESVWKTGDGELKFALAKLNGEFPLLKRVKATFGNVILPNGTASAWYGVILSMFNFYRPGSTICVPNIPNIHPMYENYIVAKGAVPVSSVATTGGYVVSDSEADTPDVGVLILTEDAVTASSDTMIVSAHEGDVTDKAMVGLREDTAGVGTASGKITVSDTPADLDTSGILIVTK